MSESSPRLAAVRPKVAKAGRRIASVLLAALAAGCAGNPWNREVLYTYAGVTLYREYIPEGEAPGIEPYAHPVDLEEEPLGSVLRDLSYVEEYFLGLKEPKTLKVFTDEEVQRLVPPLRLAMSEVRPEERIRFLVSRSNWAELFTGASGTAGVVFQSRPGLLHIAFDSVHEKLLGAEEGRPSQIVFRTDPVEWTDGPPLVPPSGASLHSTETGETYPRWIEVDLTTKVAQDAAAETTAPAEEPPAEEAREAEPTREEERYQEVRSRIQMLKRLREDGLLTREEYERELDRALSEGTLPPE